MNVCQPNLLVFLEACLARYRAQGRASLKLRLPLDSFEAAKERPLDICGGDVLLVWSCIWVPLS